MKLSIMLLIVFLSGCAAPQIAALPPEKKEQTYKADFNTTWITVLDTLTERNLPISVAQKDSGLIVTDFVLTEGFVSPLFVHAPMEMITQGRYKLNVSVRDGDHGTKVRINAHFEKFSTLIFETIPSWKPQHSIGILESELFEEIKDGLSLKVTPIKNESE